MKKLFSLLTLALLTMSAWAQTTVNFDFTSGYENAQEVTSVYDEANGVTIAFAKGTGSNAPAWYTTGQAVRVYAGGTITVSADQTIVAIEFTFGTGDNTNAITSDPAGYSEPKWTGSANEVTFTVGGTSKHRRIAGFYRKRRRVRRYIRAALVDYGYDAHGHRSLCDHKAVGPLNAGYRPPRGVRKLNYFPYPGCHALYAGIGQRQAVYHHRTVLLP